MFTRPGSGTIEARGQRWRALALVTIPTLMVAKIVIGDDRGPAFLALTALAVPGAILGVLSAWGNSVHYDERVLTGCRSREFHRQRVAWADVARFEYFGHVGTHPGLVVAWTTAGEWVPLISLGGDAEAARRAIERLDDRRRAYAA